MDERIREIPLQPVALFTGLVPIIGVNLCYLLAASNGHVPWCNPYLDGCTSVSATGRHPPEAFIFRATMIPAAVLLSVYWPLAVRWLQRLGDTAKRAHAGILFLGVSAGVFLIVYATVLGEVGHAFRLQRQIGATVYFAFTFLAQLIFTQRLFVVERRGQSDLPVKFLRALFVPCVLMFLIGLSSVILQIVWDNYDLVEDTIEWQFAIVMHAWFVVSFFAWRRSRFVARLATSID